MSDATLRSSLIRLASEQPELRPHLLPLLREAAPADDLKKVKEHLVEAAALVAQMMADPGASGPGVRPSQLPSGWTPSRLRELKSAIVSARSLV